MTASQLIEELKQLQPGTEIRIASQPSWPFEWSIGGLVVTEEGEEAIAYLSEGDQIGYLPQDAAIALGWGEENETDEN